MTSSSHSKFRVLEGAVRKQQSVLLRVNAEEALETKSLNGAEYLVVPMIILVEGVLHASNAEHPALALAEEFGLFPESWNGRPVVYNHPKEDGQPVSANSPKQWDKDGSVIGFLFNTGMKQKQKKKLRTYAWLDKSRTPKEVFETLDAGESLEVSTGIYTLEEQVSGEFDGKHYDVIWRHIVPDHLAVLQKGSIGACSNEDGCGAPRNNERSTPMKVSEQAQKLFKSFLALCGCDVNKQPKTLEEKKDFLTKTFKQMDAVLTALGLRANEVSDTDKRTALESALATAYEGVPCYILAVFSDNVVYACLDWATYSWHTYKRSYSVAEGGTVTLSGEPQEVRPETQYVPLVVTVEEPAVTTNERTEDMSNPQNQAKPAEQPVAAAAAPAQPAEQPVEKPIPKAKSLKELAEMADPETKAKFEALIAAEAKRGAELVKALSGKVGLSDDDLKAMPIDNLEKMAKALKVDATVIDNSGAGGGSQPTNSTEKVQGGPKVEYTAPTPLFAELAKKPAEQKAA